MDESEGRKLAGIPKCGEPRDQWAQERPNTLTNTFGVTDELGQTIKGLHAEFEVFISPRLGLARFVFSLKRFELGRIERAYQLHINCRQGIRATDHGYSHEHYGVPRFNADASWANASFEDAVKMFCTRTNLTLTGVMPDYLGFALK
jgi:hypothetical protein